MLEGFPHLSDQLGGGDGRVCDEFVLPETGDLPKRAWHSAEIVMAPFVFVGQQFPQAEFKRPVYVDQLVGSCDFDIKYYDPKHNEVTAAEALGRYHSEPGVVEVGASMCRRRRR